MFKYILHVKQCCITRYPLSKALLRYPRHGAFVEGVENFDAKFFGISPPEACVMDDVSRWMTDAWMDRCLNSLGTSLAPQIRAKHVEQCILGAQDFLNVTENDVCPPCQHGACSKKQAIYKNVH